MYVLCVYVIYVINRIIICISYKIKMFYQNRYQSLSGVRRPSRAGGANLFTLEYSIYMSYIQRNSCIV